jgi:hypothetical protein
VRNPALDFSFPGARADGFFEVNDADLGFPGYGGADPIG